jgi:nitrogen fixation protein FixH
MSNGEAAMESGISQGNRQALRNPWVLGWIALVTIVLGVNIFMVTMAFTTGPGLVHEDYYERGRDYERTIETRIAARAALGWKLKLESARAIKTGQPAAFNLFVEDKVGAPLANANVMVNAYRPSDAESDFVIPLAEKVPGQYVGDLVFPLKGIWDVIIEVKQGEDAYQITRRISVGT